MRPVRLAIYGDVNLNLIDGSAIWLASMAYVLHRITRTLLRGHLEGITRVAANRTILPPPMVAPAFVDAAARRPARPTWARRLFYVGTFAPGRGVLEMVAAFARLRDQHGSAGAGRREGRPGLRPPALPLEPVVDAWADLVVGARAGP